MTRIEELFTLSDWELVHAWRDARIEEIEARFGTTDTAEKAHAHRKLAAKVIRLVISLRAAGRERVTEAAPSRHQPG
jgi:hypothetical protein